ncbi:hypothetical protein CARUB_v10018953mg [Capsella rubella]|uniref:Pre-mRNA-splicing factor SLU7 n=2 Tax=Capsella rubella TaxID=81985 RepID=R0HK66_9BRAS|nr:hypothetical protein CARUB_v10018953mg [Capsella rubella]
MATASVGFMSRKDRRKQFELEEARKAGLAPAEVDKNGKEINPHIPQCLLTPWYAKSQEQPSLKQHQENRKTQEPVSIEACDHESGAKTYHHHQAEKYRKGACQNCGAMTHDVKTCIERPRKVGAKHTNKNIAPDERIKSVELDYDGKRDRWNGYDTSNYRSVMDRFDAKEDARKKYLKEQHLKKLEEKKNSDGDEEEDNDLRVDESKQRDFGRVTKRVRTTDGGSTGTVRNLRIREDTAKYLQNLDVHSAYYDPKSRSMREDPLPHEDPNESFCMGDNQYRNSGQALEFKQLYTYSYEAFEKGLHDIHMQAAPSQTELIYKRCKVGKENQRSQMKESIMAKYGNAAAKDDIPRELLLG